MDSVELKGCGIVTYIPENSISVEITVKYMDGDDMIITAKRTMSSSEVYSAMRDYEENYVDPDAVYVLTDKGKNLLKKEKSYEE